MGAWRKEFQSILGRLKREPGYVYFKVPVNPIALHIPLYPYLVKYPMDLGTVEAKLSSGAFESQETAAFDVLTCFNNALLFNGPASTCSDVYKSAKSIRALFVKLYRSKFLSDPPHVGFDVAAPNPIPEEERVELTKPNVAILLDMLGRLRKKYEKALEPFIYCVDPERYPDYYQKVGDPVALSVVESQAKLELYGYQTFGHFAAESRRIWSNCQLYNGQDKLSRQAGKIAAKFEKYLTKALSDMRSIVVIDGPANSSSTTKVVLPIALPSSSPVEMAPVIKSEPFQFVQGVCSKASAENQPFKSNEKAKDMEPAALPEASRDQSSITLRLAVPSQLPFDKVICLSVVSKLIKDKRSQLFRDPVPDTVPGYRDVIHRPMDLKTVRANIQTGRYQNNDEFVADVAQIWENCRIFNGPSPITDLANILALKFERDLLPLLSADRPPGTDDSKPVVSHPKAKMPEAKPSKANLPETNRIITKTTEIMPPETMPPETMPPNAILAERELPEMKPVETASAVCFEPEVSVKLESAIHPSWVCPIGPSLPIPSIAADASLICIPTQPMTRTSSRLCSTILRSIISLDLAGDFMDPLDPVLYNYVGYEHYVKRRMDIKTVRKNLDADRYPTPNDFLNDLNLVFLNALAYPGTPVLTKIAARYLCLHVETGFLEAFPGANAKQNLQQSWVHAARTALNEVGAFDFGRLFAEPVNPIIFNLLEYYERIETPRDLSTVTKRLNAGIYGAASEFLADIDLIWSNCMLYHGDSNPDLTDVAVNCRTVFLEAFDRALSGVSTSESTSTELTSLLPVTRDASSAAPKSTAKRPTPTPAVHLIRRLKKMDTQQVFHFPVDQTIYPEYTHFVTSPMDLGTIESKLLEGGYSTIGEYIADVRLIFSNCAAYNAEGTPIRSLGTRMSSVFESHLEKSDIQASLDEIRAKLDHKREEKVRKEKEKEEKQKVALQQKAAKKSTESTKRKSDASIGGPPQKAAKIDQSKIRKTLPPVPVAVQDELVFKTLPPRIPMPLSVRTKILHLIRAQTSTPKLTPKSMASASSKRGARTAHSNRRNEELSPLVPTGSSGIKFRLGRQLKAKSRPNKYSALSAAPIFSLPVNCDVEMDVDAYTNWDSKVQSWFESVQSSSNSSVDCCAR